VYAHFSPLIWCTRQSGVLSCHPERMWEILYDISTLSDLSLC